MTPRISVSTTLTAFIVLAALLAGLQVGCGRHDDSVVARVGDEDITIAEFQAFLDQNPVGFRSAQDEFDGSLQ